MPGAVAAAARDEHIGLDVARRQLEDHGFAIAHVSAGSTPTMRHYHRSGITEFRPGTYVFGDRQQLALKAVEPDDIALTVVATVIARSDDSAVTDAGGKALGRDGRVWLDGFGEVRGARGAVVDVLYDHHSVLRKADGYAVGARVEIIPNNANSAANLHGSVWSIDNDAAVFARCLPAAAKYR